MPMSNTSALNGTTVEARNEPMNNPMYPSSSNQSITIAKIKLSEENSDIFTKFLYLIFNSKIFDYLCTAK
jgi:hypothetical protein